MTTEIQRNNLIKLADYLDALPANYRHFSMQTYAAKDVTFDDYDDEAYFADEDVLETPAQVIPTFINECGSCACAIGHAPLAGIPVEPDDSWISYEQRSFGVSGHPDHETYRAWDYMFGPDNSNDPKEAAERIRTFLESGVPA
jgi:hypothetical protein